MKEAFATTAVLRDKLSTAEHHLEEKEALLEVLQKDKNTKILALEDEVRVNSKHLKAQTNKTNQLQRLIQRDRKDHSREESDYQGDAIGRVDHNVGAVPRSLQYYREQRRSEKRPRECRVVPRGATSPLGGRPQQAFCDGHAFEPCHFDFLYFVLVAYFCSCL